MSAIKITIDGQEIEVQPGQSVLDGARALGIDIPTLCYLEKCGPLTSCLVCLVKINGRLTPSCGTKAVEGMVVESETAEVHEARRTAMELLFSDHVGDCLAPCHRLCPLQLNIPVMLREVEADKLDAAISLVRQALPLPSVLGRLCNHPCEQGCRRGGVDDPAAIRNVERFVADHDLQRAEPHLPSRKPLTGQSVAIVGAGPAGLAAAWQLARQGHSVTVLDRHERAGGSLRAVPETELPLAILEAELNQLQRLGVEFRFKVELGNGTALEELRREFNAVILAVGEVAKAEGELLGVPIAGASIKVDAETFATQLPGVFAAGAAVKPVKALVRAMTEGRNAAECVQQFLSGQPIRRRERPFSSVMGRVEPGELQVLLRGVSVQGRRSPSEPQTGFTSPEATGESSRCLHCDCRSAGHCAFQHYAQVYEVDANRFRAQRQPLEQQLQPGGVIFEPGKCILCGICVKLTELAGEPLGLSFIGRGFDVRIAAPLNQSIEAGLKKIAAECVAACPTGALAMR